ncbi:hypothetical protein GGR57DRAFT_498273 [Xylariaceae sp. FL1272]|nr:hypothetical protein GGR57DRAFT_498273 [Xylariaceae sp. FL1272]
MSEAYERERQNNHRLEELSAKVSSLRGITVDIYDNARAQDVLDNTVRASNPFRLLYTLCLFLPPQASNDTFSNMSSQLRGSAGRLGRMAASGNKVAILKLSGIVIGVFLVLYYGLKLIF